MRHRFLLTILLPFIAGHFCGAQDRRDLHLYILMGQSNMAGRGVLTDKYKNEGDARVLMFTKDGQWVQARHPLHFDKPVAAVGPGLAFGLKMAKENRRINIGLIPCAVGGTSIQHWKPGAYDAQTKTHPYDDAILRIRAAMKFGVVKGVIWHQGEADRAPDRSVHYSADLRNLIAMIREEVGDPNLPFVVGELAPFLQDHKGINDQLSAVVREDSGTAIASAKGLTHKGDTVHFDSKSATILGERFARAMKKLR